MMCHFIAWSPEKWVLGNGENNPAAGPKGLPNFLQRASIVFDVFDDIERSDDIEFLAERYR